MIAVVKHFAANNQEGFGGPEANSASPRTARQWITGKRDVVGDRTKVDVNVDQRTLQEVYFPQFEAAVRQADVGAVMCAHNKVNGDACVPQSHAAHQGASRRVGLQGDGAVGHSAAANTAQSLRNGLDFEPFPGTTYGPDAVRARTRQRTGHDA